MTSTSPPLTDLPLGPRVERVLSVAYAARRPVLLEGHTGIGKSAIVDSVTKRLGVQLVVLDLSLLEPPDLVGIPFLEGGRTVHGRPRVLPSEGAGILLLEELNRAERYMQQPALQLLTARRLHDYELPSGWVCFAATNPDDGVYQTNPLDPALRARFLTIGVHVDRYAWLDWAKTAGVHDAVISLVTTHDRCLDDVPPRTWTYVSDVLRALPPGDRADLELAREIVAGYLPRAWADTLVRVLDRRGGELEFRVLDLLGRYDRDASLRRHVRALVSRGRTDEIDEVAHRLRGALSSPKAGAMIDTDELTLSSFEALLADLPGDTRELLQEAIGSNPTATKLIEIDPAAFLEGTAEEDDVDLLATWAAEPEHAHRAALAVTAIAAFAQSADLDDEGARRLGELATAVGDLGAPLEALAESA